MAFTGNEGAPISIDTATQWTENFRNAKPDDTRAYFFGLTSILSVLSQKGAVGIRLYNGIDNNGENQLLVAGVDGFGNDILPKLIVGLSVNCPPDCGKPNKLNGL